MSTPSSFSAMSSLMTETLYVHWIPFHHTLFTKDILIFSSSASIILSKQSTCLWLICSLLLQSTTVFVQKYSYFCTLTLLNNTFEHRVFAVEQGGLRLSSSIPTVGIVWRLAQSWLITKAFPNRILHHHHGINSQ